MADVLQSAGYAYSDILQPYMPVFYVSFLATITLTPLMRALAHRHGVVDDPDNRRKVHTRPIAYLGGVSIFLGWIAGVSVSVFLHTHNGVTPTIQVPPGVLVGAFTMVIFGLLDDIYGLSPRVKLFGQFVAAMALIVLGVLPIPGIGRSDFLLGLGKGPAWMVLEPIVRMGFVHAGTGRIEDIQAAYPILHFLAPLFSGAVAIFVIIATCNATNLLDGLDGLCSGVTGVMSLGYLILALYLAHAQVTTAGGGEIDPVRITLALALLGAVLGFLPFNFNPASIFMGDTGSMFLGYMCGLMILLFGQNGTVRWFLSAIIMFGLPMMDTFLAIVRRKLNGKKIFSPDSDHFHHFLVKHGFTVKRAVLLSYGIAAIFVSFALVIVIMPTPLAIGVYLVLFGWIIVAAFKIGMVFQQSPAITANTALNVSVIQAPAMINPPPPGNGAGNGKDGALQSLVETASMAHADEVRKPRESTVVTS